jgi:hypothetical protein
MPIQVPEDVLNGITAVRDSGETNMLDRARVIELLEAMGHFEAASWVAGNREEYSRGIFQGFEAK